MLMLVYVGYRLASLAGVGAAFRRLLRRYLDDRRCLQRLVDPLRRHALGRCRSVWPCAGSGWLLFSGVWTVASAALTDGTTLLLAALPPS
jgi:hypothetical protein